MSHTPEPIYLAQNGENLTDEQVRKWFRDRAQEAHEKHGCTAFRYSIHDDIPGLILIEGWTEQPDEYGQQRWQLTASPTEAAE